MPVYFLVDAKVGSCSYGKNQQCQKTVRATTHFRINQEINWHVQLDFNHTMYYTPTYTLLVIYFYPLPFDKCQILQIQLCVLLMMGGDTV